MRYSLAHVVYEFDAMGVDKMKLAQFIEAQLREDEEQKIRQIKHSTHRQRKQFGDTYGLTNELYELGDEQSKLNMEVDGYLDKEPVYTRKNNEPLTIRENMIPVFPHDDDCTCSACVI